MFSMYKIGHRIYSDYFMRSRLDDYEALLLQALRAGYRLMTVRDFCALPDAERQRILVLRHDIDTDVVTARQMFEVERRNGVRASYYFRRSTLDLPLMRQIEAFGSEASYHFEEVADFAKRWHIRCATQLRLHMEDIEDQFYLNFCRIQRQCGFPMTTVASHGDFVNRRLGVINNEILNNDALRRRCGIVCEAYDLALLSRFDIYITDCQYPQRFKPISPLDALGQFEHIYFTTHPVHWHTNWRDSSMHNFQRMVEELAW